MNAKQYLMAAKMLELAADEFSNHGSNDYSLENTPENRTFVEAMIAASDYPEDEVNISHDYGRIYTSDIALMGFCIRLLREEARRLNPSPASHSHGNEVEK